ncbi:DUF4381 domain-containing protein [Woeseia oceani]|uniref:DUF4381 domain-containing protein n=1 Tax=Woeseia oceani TaxID=1548547 RepID=A0A193LIY1_9GAMM|nr:DUF4381 domain-containing protein [Woeseia oceani]ANO52349.1 hypothetical protein BA177_15165 [Woeseia oceani]
MNPENLPLRDLHLPEPIGWWPLAPGWWFLIALAATGILWLLWRAWRQWQRAAVRRIALRELNRLEGNYQQDGNAVLLARQLSALTRRTMLAYAPRLDIAGLTGEAWLAFLDRGLPSPVFVAGPGRNLESLPYRAERADTAQVDVPALIAAVKQRLATPLPEERV